MRHVCERCNGNGWVDKWKGGMTRSDLDEMFGGHWEDEQEFLQDYVAGVYGDRCPACKGEKVVDDFVCVKCKETRLPGENDIEWIGEYWDEDEEEWVDPSPPYGVGTECSDCTYDPAQASEDAYFNRTWAI